MPSEVFQLGATTPPNAFAHADAYLQASAQADWSFRRGVDLTAGFDLQGKVNAAASDSGVAAAFGAGVDISGALAFQAALPIDLFSADGAGLIARLQAKLALTAFVTAVLSLDRAVLEQTVQAQFGGPMSSLLDIVLDELDISAGFWGRVSIAIEAVGEAVLAGTLLPSADGGAGLSFSARYETAFIYGAGTHFITNLGFAHPQRLFTRLTGAISNELLALVTPDDPDEASLVAVGLGALHTLLPVAIRGLLQLGLSLVGDPPAASSTATSTLASSLIAQGQQAVLQAVSDLATGLLGDALTDARLVAALSRFTAADIQTVTGLLSTLQTDFEALTGTDISDIDEWLTGLLTCVGDIDNVLTSLTGLGVPAPVTGNVQAWAALLWAAGTLLERIISWADDTNAGSPFSGDPVTPTPPASLAAKIKAGSGTVSYADVATYLITCQVVTDDLEAALRNAIPQAGAAFDWLNTVLGTGEGQLLQTLFQDLAAPSSQQATTLITQLATAASDAVANHILPELLEPLTAAETDPAVAAFIEDVVKPCLTELPQTILPAVAGLGTGDATLRMREAVSALLLQITEHFLATTLKTLIDHALTNAQAALGTAATDVSTQGNAAKVIRDIDALAAVLVAGDPLTVLLLPSPSDVVGILTLAGTVARNLEQMSDDLFAMVDNLMQFALGSDATRPASMQALTGTDEPVDQSGLTQTLQKVGDAALKTAGDVLDNVPALIADHVKNEPAEIVTLIEQVASQAVATLNTAINNLETWIETGLVPEINKLAQQFAAWLGQIGAAVEAFGQHLPTLVDQAVEAVRKEGLQLIEGLMGGPPVSWVQHAIVDLYNVLFDAIAGLADLLSGILGAAAAALGEVLTAIAGGAHHTQSSADDTVRQAVLAASQADLSFDLKVSVLGVTLLDLGTVTISSGVVGGAMHDLISGDTTGGDVSYQSTLTNGVQAATMAAGVTAQKAAAQTQLAVGTRDLSGLQATVAGFTLSAAPVVEIATPVQGASVPFGARVLIRVTGVNPGFVENTLGVAPRIVITVNGTRWFYQPSDWITANEAGPGDLMLQADLVAVPVSGGLTATPTEPLAPQQAATQPPASVTFNGRAGTLMAAPIGVTPLQAQTGPVPPIPPIHPPPPPPPAPQPIDLTSQPWTRRALLRLALAKPSGTVTGSLAGTGRFTASGSGAGQRAPVPVPAPWVLSSPPPDPTISRSVPVMVGRFGLNTISVAIADGAGHTATAATTVIIEPGPLYAISARHSGSCLTIAGGDTADAAGAAAQQWPWAGTRNQMWNLQPAVIGAGYWLTADHSGQRIGVASAPAGDYDDWRMCAKCQGLFFQDWTTPSPCAGSGTHDPAGSPDYFLARNAQFMSAAWSQCAACSAAFIASQGSVCPAGGAHQAVAGQTWGLDRVNLPAPGEQQWQWCILCAMLVPAGGGTGVCPAGPRHIVTPGVAMPAEAGREPSAVKAPPMITPPPRIPTLVVPASGTNAVNGTPLTQDGGGGPWQLLPAPDSRYTRIQRLENGKAAEVAAASTPAGAVIDQADWSGGDNQQWRLTPAAEIDPGAYYIITSQYNGSVLAVGGGPQYTNDGAGVVGAPGNGQPNQRWRFLPNTDGSLAIVPEHSGSCLTAVYQTPNAQGSVIQYHPTTGSSIRVGEQISQSWRIIPDQPGYYMVQSTVTRGALTVAGDGTVVQMPPAGRANQQWSLSMVTGIDTGAWYTITARHSGLSLGVAGGPSATQPGTAVEQSVAANAANQRWRLQPAATSGYYVLVPQHTTLVPGPAACLDLADGAAADGTPAAQNTQTGAASQQWQLIPVEPGTYKIQNLATGKVLQAGAGPAALAPGTAAQEGTWTGDDNQKWWLTR
jgi:hypothetical protein